jgi:hypothetical protein
MEDKFFEELEEVEQEYIDIFQQAKNIVGIDLKKVGKAR